jgi:hypothetical protein
MSDLEIGSPTAQQLPEQSDQLAGGAPGLDGEVQAWNYRYYKTRVFPADEGRVVVQVTLLYEGDESLIRLSMTAYDGPGYIDCARQALISDIEAELAEREAE